MFPKLLLLQAGLFLALLTANAQTTSGPNIVRPAEGPSLAMDRGRATFPAGLERDPYEPTRAEIIERYRKARFLDSIATRSIFKATVRPHWSADNTSFWYRNFLKDSVKEYISVDMVHGTRTMLTAEPADTLPRGSRFRPYTGRRWASFSTDSLSPDKQWVACIQDGNVFIRPAGSPRQNTSPYTTNGDTAKPYGQLAWSPDSKYVVGYHINPIHDSAVYYVLSSVAGTTRGQLHRRPYKQPGDPFTTYEMFLFRPEGHTTIRVNTPLVDFFGTPELHWRHNDNRWFTFERVERGHQRFRIFEVDATNGETRTVLDEQTRTFIYESRLFTFYLPESNELLMSSEKDGWQHLYLVDLLTGKQKQEITRGPWIVRNVDSVDPKKREIWFSGSGMNPGEDPYYVHYYRIGFDGRHLIDLTPEKANHIVTFSPDRKYYLDAWSEINVPTTTELRRTSDGKKLLEVEKADASLYLSTGLRLPEPFVAKGRDGVTDIWGIIVRPADFDPAKRYPVIENIYAGPQDAFVPKDFTGRYGEMQSIAQLGFIVVQIDGMGTANRSKAFHDVCWRNIADAGFPDRILWIEALAAKYPYVDTTRVGLYGTSAGGQNSLGGLLFHGDFYKAAVSSCGCHDNRIDKQWWNEQWMGYPVGRHYDEQSNVTNAWRLRGDLLLMVGEADNNVPPESTYRVADALIKAGKTFEFLPLPGSDHTDGGPYGRIQRRDFFVRHLLGVEPPNRNAISLTPQPTTTTKSVTIDYDKQTHPQNRFWAYFGYDEPNYTYMRDGQRLLNDLGRLSRPTIAYVRCHNLLTTGDGTPALKWGSTNAYTEDANGNPVYDWHIVDSIFDTYLQHGLRPLAEIGFMPEALSTHPEPYHHHWRPGVSYDSIFTGWAYPPKSYEKWATLIETWVRHCVQRYGEKEVATWLWEVWNEPDIPYWRGTEEEYFKLYDYSANAVKKALPSARIGGPATTSPRGNSGSRWLRDFLNHCAKTKIPLDFISFHAKGSPKFIDGHVRMNMEPQLRDVTSGFAIVKASPYGSLPIYITECDPEGCAACGMATNPENAYRNGTMYSSYTAASFARIAAIADSMQVNLAAAMSWSFEFEGQKYFDGFRDLATNGIGKPVLNVFRMYGMMHGNRIPVDNAFVTADKHALYIMVWNYTDDDLPNPAETTTLDLTHLPAKNITLTHYRIDDSLSNSYEAWKKMGSPQDPTPTEYRILDAAGFLQQLGAPKNLGTTNGTLTLPITLPPHAVSLIKLEF